MPSEKEEKTPEQFAEAYQALCKEYGYQLRTIPEFLPRDDGTFSVVVKIQVVKINNG